MAGKPFKLPLAVVGPIEINRLLRELSALDTFLRQSTLRHAAAKTLPRTSKLLEEIGNDNKLNLLEQKDRTQLASVLTKLKTNAPLLHISFGADPSAVFLGKLLTWLRKEIHPMVLIQIGLQPSIAAGCVIRTKNKYFDFSLRRHFQDNIGMLIHQIGAGSEQQ